MLCFKMRKKNTTLVWGIDHGFISEPKMNIFKLSVFYFYFIQKVLSRCFLKFKKFDNFFFKTRP